MEGRRREGMKGERGRWGEGEGDERREREMGRGGRG
jgi:hypothetical protein